MPGLVPGIQSDGFAHVIRRRRSNGRIETARTLRAIVSTLHGADAPTPIFKHCLDRGFRIGVALVMGRGTYDFLAKDDSPWAYSEQRVLVVTSQPIPNPKGHLETRCNVDDLITELRGLSDGDVWVLGGGQLQMAFIERCALHAIEIYVMPELIGGGRPLFPLQVFGRACACFRRAPSTEAAFAFTTPSTILLEA